MVATNLQISPTLSNYDNGVLSNDALVFLEKIVSRFSSRRDALLQAREAKIPDFLPDSDEIRRSDWRVAEAPMILQDRRVEITAPAERKKIIQALNSPAKVYMADFEDSMSPTAENLINGQQALMEAVRGKCELQQGNKQYQLNPKHECVLLVRPRGWHLPEKHVLLNGVAIAGAFFDFALFFFHNAKALIKKGRGAYFYLPKVEHWREAELWNDVMTFAEKELNLEKNSTKATLLIETLPAVFQMHEILYAMRQRLVGLNCGRWDYIFSYIKTLRACPDRILPERRLLGMDKPFLKAYALELIETCHHRGAHAMGGMAAFLPIRNNTIANDIALEEIRIDKQREAQAGHDGSWVAHPGLIPLVTEIYNTVMPTAHQKLKHLNISHSADDLLAVPTGDISAIGFYDSIKTAVRYIANWLDGKGAVPISNIMEDAATAEIIRFQLWQWQRYGVSLAGGGMVTTAFFCEQLKSATKDVAAALQGDRPTEKLQDAASLLEEIVCTDMPPDFFTLVAYTHL